MCWRYKRYICLDTDTDTATVVGIGSVLKDIVQKLISGMYLLSQILPTRKCFVRYFPVSGGTASELFSVWLTSPPPAFESPQIWLTSCPVWAVLCPFQLVIPPPFFLFFSLPKFHLVIFLWRSRSCKFRSIQVRDSDDSNRWPNLNSNLFCLDPTWLLLR